MRSRWIVLVWVAGASLGLASAGSAFERDTHYYGTFALSLTTCFDWEEAHLIASADVGVDGSRGTVAELNPTHRHNKAAWHAFGHPVERYYELWERAVLEDNEDLRLIALGQFLHFLQDWEAHAGFPVHLGHAKATILGHDPDSMARSETRTRHAVQATLDHLALMCGEMGRLPDGVGDSDVALPLFLGQVVGNRLIGDLIESSDPAWRADMKGVLTERGSLIMTQNIQRIERYILDEIAPRPGKNVPEDFLPGSDARGIPEPLELDFDSEGRLLSDLANHLERAGKHPEDDHLDAGDHHVRVARAKPTKSGWKVWIEVTNTGDKTMPSAPLTAIAVDGLGEEHLGEATTRVPDVGPDETVSIKLKIPTTRPAETALIGVSVDSKHDRDPYNSDVWHITDQDRDELEDHVAAYGHLHGVSEVPEGAVLEVVTEPRAWVADGRLLCTSHVARGTSVDPTVHVQGPLIFMSPERGDGVELTSVVPTVWTITPSHPGQLPAVKAFACFDLLDDLCPWLEGTAEPLHLESVIALGDARASSMIDLGGELGDQIEPLCGGFGRRQFADIL